MALDPVVNFFRSTIATLPVASGGTSIVLQTGDGNKLPAPAIDGAFNLTIYNADDPFVAPEIVRVTARSGDTLTVTRAQEGTSATNKTTGSTWNVELTPTAKTIQDIDTAKLDVAGGTMTGTLTATKLIPSGNVTAGNGMYLPAANTVAFSTNGVERVRIDASGNVGIGETPSLGRLQVRQVTDSSLGGLFITSVDGFGAVISRLNSGDMTFRNGGSDRMVITSTGTLQPSADNTQPLGTASFRWSAITAGGTVTGGKFVPTANTTAGNGMYLPTTNQVAIGTNGTEALRIDSSQNVGVSSTVPIDKFAVRNFGIDGNANVESRAYSILSDFKSPNADNTAVDLFTFTSAAPAVSLSRATFSGQLIISINGRSNAPTSFSGTYIVPILVDLFISNNVTLTLGSGTLIKRSTNASGVDIDSVTIALANANTTSATLQVTVDLSGGQTADQLRYTARLDGVSSGTSSTHLFTIVPA